MPEREERRPGPRALLRRRDLLQQGVAATLGAATLPLAVRRAWGEGPPAVRGRRRLGRTGLEISDISFGSSRTTEPDVVRYALARGINYFDTAEGYRGGRSEEAIGRALAGERQRVFVASKVHAGAAERRVDFERALEGSLRRLRTDYVDVYFNHAVNDVGRLQNDEWYEFIERAREQGKLRWSGVSGHGGRLVECLDYALDRDLVDVILVAYNFGQDPRLYEQFTRGIDLVATQPELPRALAKAREKDVGIVAMKTLRGARLNDMRPYEREGGTFAQAAFRWVLSSPDVDALVVSMTAREQVDEFLRASGAKALREGDAELLRRYAALNDGSYCRPGCDACAASCPQGVPIAEVLRTRMYATDYGDLELALEDYAKLGAGAAACVGCAAPCSGACPHGLAIPALTGEAERLLARG